MTNESVTSRLSRAVERLERILRTLQHNSTAVYEYTTCFCCRLPYVRDTIWDVTRSVCRYYCIIPISHSLMPLWPSHWFCYSNISRQNRHSLHQSVAMWCAQWVDSSELCVVESSVTLLSLALSFSLPLCLSVCLFWLSDIPAITNCLNIRLVWRRRNISIVLQDSDVNRCTALHCLCTCIRT